MRTLLLLVLALPACTRAAPGDPPALPAAEAKMAEGRYGEAVRDLRGIPLADLPLEAQRVRVAEAAKKGRDFALVARVLEADRRGSVPARLLRVEGILRSGNLDGAKEALAEMEREGIRPERWRFLHALLGLARNEKGERDAAVQALGELVQEGSRDPEVLVRWAETVLSVPAEARRRLTEALDRVDDRGPVLAALGAVLLRKDGDPGIARLHLEEAVRLRPFDRDARLDLVRAGLRRGGEVAVGRAVEEGILLVAQDPDDGEARLTLAEAYGEKGRLALDPRGVAPSLPAIRAWDLAEREYEELLRRGVADPPTAVRALLGLARIHVEEVPLDDRKAALAPGSHYAKAMEILRRAEELDPEGKLRGGPYEASLLAENYYLRGRASRKAHVGDLDHTDALGWFQKAFNLDKRHIDASWDLGSLCADFFAQSKEYQQLAYTAFRSHVTMREKVGAPPLDPERMKIAEDAAARVGRTLLPGPPKKP
jgi:tetratricopeptide (TPR) repeat protein